MAIPLTERSCSDIPSRLQDCPLCASTEIHYAFRIQGQRYEACPSCGFLFANPRPTPEDLARIYQQDYYLCHYDTEQRERVGELKRASARYLLDLILDYSRRHSGAGMTLLDVGCGQGYLLAEAETKGFRVTGVDVSEEAVESSRQRCRNAQVFVRNADCMSLPEDSFDVVVLSDSIEHVLDPVELMASLRRFLKPGGAVLVATPSLESWSRRFMKDNWLEFKAEHLTYFRPTNLQVLLYKTGFQDIRMHPLKKALNLEYIFEHFRRYSWNTLSEHFFKRAYRFLPWFVVRRPLMLSGSGMIALAAKGRSGNPQPVKLSVVVPAFDEQPTVGVVMEQLLHKRIPGMEMEIVVVESNSRDGTRDAVLAFKDRPGVKIILEDEPRGKGHAVRRGLQHVTGDIVMIQDADLEYDMHDYESLLRPIVQLRRSFVLGSRHLGGVFKMRRFEHNPFLAAVVNLGHYVLTLIFNTLYGQRLRDPFTMFKVFRADCIQGMEFTCNRFDFDIELVARLIQRGFKPLEVPVNYVSRSFKEGKKVSFLKDPIRILAAMLKMRLF